MSMSDSPIYCEHANECPQVCPCPEGCYCKFHTCINRQGIAQKPAPQPMTAWERISMKDPEDVSLRVAFAGASGTGKTTMADHIVATLKIPFNPVGSRSVSKAMGFDSPYDVDKAGKRAEFQRRLVIEKRAWEDGQESFVTDRTTLDNLTYTMLHDIKTIDAAFLEQIVGGLHRYTHVIYCPADKFCNPGGDPNRVQDMTYQHLYDATIKGLLDKYLPKTVKFSVIDTDHLETRKRGLDRLLREPV